MFCRQVLAACMGVVSLGCFAWADEPPKWFPPTPAVDTYIRQVCPGGYSIGFRLTLSNGYYPRPAPPRSTTPPQAQPPPSLEVAAVRPDLIRDTFGLAKFDVDVRPASSSAARAIERGIRAYDRGAYQAAADVFTEAIGLDFRDPDAYQDRAIAELALGGEGDRVIRDMNLAISLAPASAPRFLDRAEAWWLLHDPERALADADTVVAMDPNWEVGYQYRAGFRLHKGDLGGALDDANRAVVLSNPSDPAPYQFRSAVWLLRRQFDLALIDMERAVRLGPDVLEYRYHRGLLRALVGDLDGALADLDKVIGRAPETPMALSSRSMLWAAQGAFEPALADAEAALRLDPEDPLAHLNRGVALMCLGRHAEARASLESALRLAPDMPMAHNDLAMLLAACPEASVRDGRKAFDSALRSLDGSGNASRSFSVVALALAELGDTSEAARWEQAALDAPDRPIADNPALARARLALFRAGLPCRYDFTRSDSP